MDLPPDQGDQATRTLATLATSGWRIIIYQIIVIGLNRQRNENHLKCELSAGLLHTLVGPCVFTLEWKFSKINAFAHFFSHQNLLILLHPAITATKQDLEL